MNPNEKPGAVESGTGIRGPSPVPDSGTGLRYRTEIQDAGMPMPDYQNQITHKALESPHLLLEEEVVDDVLAAGQMLLRLPRGFTPILKLGGGGGKTASCMGYRTGRTSHLGCAQCYPI